MNYSILSAPSDYEFLNWHFEIPCQLVAQKLGLPLITTKNVVCFFVIIPFISCTLFCELAYLIWPLHFSHLLWHSSPVTYWVSTLGMSQIIRSYNFVSSYPFLLECLSSGLFLLFILTGKEKVISFKNCRNFSGLYPRKHYLSVLWAQCNILSCILLFLFSNSLFSPSEEWQAHSFLIATTLIAFYHHRFSHLFLNQA